MENNIYLYIFTYPIVGVILNESFTVVHEHLTRVQDNVIVVSNGLGLTIMAQPVR